MAGANVSANLYSLVQTCKANGINSYRCLRALFVALPNASTANQYVALLPWRIAIPARDFPHSGLTAAADPHHV